MKILQELFQTEQKKINQVCTLQAFKKGEQNFWSSSLREVLFVLSHHMSALLWCILCKCFPLCWMLSWDYVSAQQHRCSNLFLIRRVLFASYFSTSTSKVRFCVLTVYPRAMPCDFSATLFSKSSYRPWLGFRVFRVLLIYQLRMKVQKQSAQLRALLMVTLQFAVGYGLLVLGQLQYCAEVMNIPWRLSSVQVSAQQDEDCSLNILS